MFPSGQRAGCPFVPKSPLNGQEGGDAAREIHQRVGPLEDQTRYPIESALVLGGERVSSYPQRLEPQVGSRIYGCSGSVSGRPQ